MKNYIRILYSILRNRITRKKSPLRTILKITKRCNLRCRHCLEYKFQDKELSLEKVKYMLNRLAKAGAIHLSINGGEPLIRTDIGEIIRYAQKLGMSVGITTNGTFVPKKIKDLKGISFLGLSLDWPKQIHDYLRGKGQFNEVMEALKVAQRHDIKNIYLNTVLTKTICQKLEYIEEVVEIAQKNKVKCNFVTMYGDVREGSVIKKPSEEELRRALQKLVQLKKRGVPFLFSEFTYEYMLNWPIFSKEKYYEGEIHQISHPITCKSGELSIAVEANGDIFPCNMVKDEVKPTNIFDLKNSVADLLKKMNKYNKCRYCYYGCYCEANALFGLKPKIILEYIKNYLINWLYPKVTGYH